MEHNYVCIWIFRLETMHRTMHRLPKKTSSTSCSCVSVNSSTKWIKSQKSRIIKDIVRSDSVKRRNPPTLVSSTGPLLRWSSWL
ncbi:hypothetical protein L5515_009654 [Caenorhabditis briggsae]|uniref:Uncharacterized protein n=1 Tax=Caenorhabditis briggsae TaxID=6238 RepID=A0AAE9FAY9_CAEBR|nr:hypothetical protein L5515_009654 [Caenorhabditis briggsae]